MRRLNLFLALTAGLILCAAAVPAETQASSLEGSLQQSLTNFRKSVEELRKNNDLLRQQMEALRLEALKFQETLRSLSSEEPTPRQKEIQDLEKTIQDLKAKESHWAQELSQRRATVERLKQGYVQWKKPPAAIEQNPSALTQIRQGFDEDEFFSARSLRDEKKLQGTLNFLQKENETLTEELLRLLMQTRNGLDQSKVERGSFEGAP